MREFDQTREFIAKIQHAQSLTKICQALLGVTGRFGLKSLCAATIPPPDAPPEDMVAHLILMTWPPEWLDFYIARGYLACDPVVAHFRNSTKPVLWRDLYAGHNDDDRVRELFERAQAFGLHDGLALSVTTLDQGTVTMSFAGRDIDLTPEDIDTVSFASAYAVGHALSLRGVDRYRDLSPVEKQCVHWIARGRTIREIAAILGLSEQVAEEHLIRARIKLGPGHILSGTETEPELSPRERECLQWAALGKSEWEMSQILGISEHTAEKHLLNAKSKLGAANRVQAVAEAVRRGVVE